MWKMWYSVLHSLKLPIDLHLRCHECRPGARCATPSSRPTMAWLLLESSGCTSSSELPHATTTHYFTSQKLSSMPRAKPCIFQQPRENLYNFILDQLQAMMFMRVQYGVMVQKCLSLRCPAFHSNQHVGILHHALMLVSPLLVHIPM
jgi:hypothetical protein